jgi:exonuclease III
MREKSAFFKARLGVKLRIGSVNVGSMTRRSGEVADMAARRRLDFCCLQETKWKGGQSRWLGNEGARYKFYWMGVRLGVLWWLGLVSW